MDGTAGFDAIFDERMDVGGGGVLDHAHANSTDALSIRLRCDKNQSLVLHSPAVSAFLPTTQVGLVQFHPTCQPIATRPNHCAPQFVQPRPSGPITAESENSLQA
jgi:hypothetical protein